MDFKAIDFGSGLSVAGRELPMQRYRAQPDAGAGRRALALAGSLSSQEPERVASVTPPRPQTTSSPWRRQQPSTSGTDAATAEVGAPGRLAEGPERPRCRRWPPFAWQPAPDYENEFKVSGDSSEIVTKVRDFKDRDWVVPVGSTLRLSKGGAYHWTLCVERKCPYRPQLQLGVHGAGHRRPWRLLTTSRCSRARDDEPWSDRPGGDRTIEEGDFVHVEVDLRGLHLPFGTLSVAVNAEPPEIVFDDIPLNSSTLIMPVVSMGGDQARVRLCPAY